MPGDEEDREARFQERLRQLRQDFSVRKQELISNILADWHLLENLDPETSDFEDCRERLVFATHSLCGTAGTFGFEEISKASGALEHGLKKLGDSGESAQTCLQNLEKEIAVLRSDIED